MKIQKPKPDQLKAKLKTRKALLILVGVLVFVLALVLRLPYLSHGLDQYDVVRYKDSLVHMNFERPTKWPVLLFFQKGLWLIMPHLTAAEVLSLTNIILSAAILAIFFVAIRRISKSYVSGLILTIGLFFMPLFAVESIVGMQDMAQTFGITLAAALLLQYCFSKNLNWLYTASAVAGLVIGIKQTLVLFIPALILVILLTGKLKLKNYLKVLGAFVIGVGIWLIPEHFIKATDGSSWNFFMEQFHLYNPHQLGFWKKAGDYVLLSGYNYRAGLFFWLPVFWFVIYLLAKRRKALSLGPAIALLGTIVTAVVSYGLHKLLGKPYWHAFLIIIVLAAAGIVYELLRLLPKYKTYFKNLKDDRYEIAILGLAILIATYFIFEYIFAGAIARYLLPIVPAGLWLMVLLSGLKGYKSWGLAFAMVAWSFWGCSFTHTQQIISNFKQLDTRSSVALFAKSHPGSFFTSDYTLPAYFDSYGVTSPINATTQFKCGPLNADKTNYVVSWGPATQQILDTCAGSKLTKVTQFKRPETVIEDSVGNRGYFIYKLSPAN